MKICLIRLLVCSDTVAVHASGVVAKVNMRSYVQAWYTVGSLFLGLN